MLRYTLFFMVYCTFLYTFIHTEKVDIQDQYLDIQLCDKHLAYSILISKYADIISKIFILTYISIFLIVKLNVRTLYLIFEQKFSESNKSLYCDIGVKKRVLN